MTVVAKNCPINISLYGLAGLYNYVSIIINLKYFCSSLSTFSLILKPVCKDIDKILVVKVIEVIKLKLKLIRKCHTVPIDIIRYAHVSLLMSSENEISTGHERSL